MKYKQILYVDIGNTLVKYAFYNKNDFFIWKKELVQSKINSENLINDLKFKKIDCVIFSSVRISKNNELFQLANELSIDIYDIKNFSLKPYFNFIEKKFLGSDLICLIAASCEYYGKDNIIISMGTATTISLVINNKYDGSIIIPGVGISADALFDKAELLKKFEFHFTNEVIKKNTQHAINLGIVNSTQKIIKCWVRDIQKYYLNTKFNIILTGGYSKILNNNLLNYIIDDFLIFKGMFFFVNKNKL